MTDISPAGLVACAHCGHLDTGKYCSDCGRELAPTEKHVLAEVWEHVVVDRLEDLREYGTTTWYMIAQPRRFFRTAMEGPARRASHAFPEPAPQALPRRAVLSAVKYLVFSFVASVLASKIMGVSPSGLIPGLVEELNEEVTLLVLMVYLALYGISFHFTTGRRISVEEAAVFNGYLAGAGLLMLAMITLGDQKPWVAVPGFVLFLYVGVMLPYVVLPRLYGLRKRRVFVAMIGAFLASIITLALGINAVTALVKAAA